MPTTDRVLILEEETLLALDIEYVLSDHGPVEVVHFRSLADAGPHLAEISGFSLAVLESRLGSAEVVAFAERLAASGVATVVMSADRESVGLFPHAAPLEKPFNSAALLAACHAARIRLNRGVEPT